MPRWTIESRALQAKRLKMLKPWKRSTGPRTITGKLRSSRNSCTHGMYAASFRRFRRALRQQSRFVRLYAILSRPLPAILPASSPSPLLGKGLEELARFLSLAPPGEGAGLGWS